MTSAHVLFLATLLAAGQAADPKTRPVTAWLATHREYHLLTIDDLPPDLRSSTSAGEIAKVAAQHEDVNRDGTPDMSAVVVRGAGASARYSIVCFNGTKTGYEPEPHWVVRDSEKCIAGVAFNAPYRITSGRHPAELLSYDEPDSEPAHRYRWNGSEYEENYWMPGEGLAVTQAADLRSAPDPGAGVVAHLPEETVVDILEPVAPKNGERWYKVQVRAPKGKTGAVGYMLGSLLDPGNG
jgi:hypothetical protein